MTVKKHNILGLIVILVFTRCTMADSLRDSARQGNGLYENKQYNEAINVYDRALVDNPESIELKFNKADCYFQLDDLGKAIDLYNEVAAESKDMTLVEKSKYNLGNCYFQRGIKQKDSDLQKAMEDMQTGIACWRNALDLRPENENAAKNIEVARLIIKDIIDQINKQKEQQQQQTQQQKQLQDQIKELAEQQKALAQKTQQTKDQAGSELEQAINAQSKAQSTLKASDGDQAVESQNKAAKHLENALKALSEQEQDQQQQKEQEQKQTQQPQNSEQSGDQQQQQPQPKEQQAQVAPDATAQEILEKEQREKEQRQLFQQGGYQNVEKDW